MNEFELESEASDDEQEDEEPESIEFELEEPRQRRRHDNRHRDEGIYKGKSFKWSTQPEQAEQVVSNENESAMVSEDGKNIRTVLDAFRLFFTVELSSMIIKFTNLRMAKEFQRSNNPAKSPFIYGRDLDAYLAILITSMILHDNDTSIELMWRSDSFQTPMYGSIMSKHKFKWIQKCIRFDDKRTRGINRDAPVKELNQLLNEAFDKHLETSSNVTVDERIVGFRGKCKFKVFMPSKPDKYGLKLWILVCSETNYIKKFTLYLGKENERQTGLGVKVVKDLVGSYTGKNITCDNYFTCYELCEDLMQNGNTLIGTVRQHRSEIPRSLKSNKQREVLSTLFRFSRSIQLTSYVPKKNRVVLIMSTTKSDTTIQPDGLKKPNMILLYNKLKCGVDLVDSMLAQHTCSRKTRRWPQCLFYNHLDFAIHNALILYRKVVDPFISRDDFCKQLALELSKNSMVERLEKGDGLSKKKKEQIYDVLREIIVNESVLQPQDDRQIEYDDDNNAEMNLMDVAGDGGTTTSKKKKRKRCGSYRCKKLSSILCSKCRTSTCKIHLSQICDRCK